MADNLKIIRGISQACADLGYDGAHLVEDEEVGLKREEGDPLLDKRVMDGFKVKIHGNELHILYHSEVQLKEVHANGFESDVDQRMSDIASWLKKEYRKVTGKSVTLTEEGEVDVMVQSTSKVRSWVQAKKHYKISGLSDEMQVAAESKDTLDKGWKSFLEQGGWKGKRPKNDTRPKNSGE